MSTFLAAMWPTFFIRVRPASRNAKPACMNMTRIAARTTQIVLAAIASSLLRHTTSTSSSRRPVRLCVTLKTGDDPADAVAVLVAGAGGVDDRVHDVVRDLVPDDEDQVRLGQEARLEDPPPVLVRDPALAAVPDGLDHRHADVAGVLLDRVHDRLDAVADDHCLDLDHRVLHMPSPPLGPTKKAPGLPNSPEAPLPRPEPSSAPPGRHGSRSGGRASSLASEPGALVASAA